MEETAVVYKNRPDIRERVKQRGAKYLSDSELIALTLRTGTRDMPVLSLAARVIRTIDTTPSDAIFEALSAIDGMGDTKATAILAAMELGRRYSGSVHKKVQTASDVFPLIQHFADRKQEQFISISLNGAHEVLAVRVVSVGILNKTIVKPIYSSIRIAVFLVISPNSVISIWIQYSLY